MVVIQKGKGTFRRGPKSIRGWVGALPPSYIVKRGPVIKYWREHCHLGLFWGQNQQCSCILSNPWMNLLILFCMPLVVLCFLSSITWNILDMDFGYTLNKRKFKYVIINNFYVICESKSGDEIICFLKRCLKVIFTNSLLNILLLQIEC